MSIPCVTYSPDLINRVTAFFEASPVKTDEAREKITDYLAKGRFEAYEEVRWSSYYEGLTQGARAEERQSLMHDIGQAWIDSEHAFEWNDVGELTGPGRASLDRFSAPHGWSIAQSPVLEPMPTA